MKIVIKKNKATLLHAVFILWAFSEMLFRNTLVSRAALVLFIGSAILISNRFRWSSQLSGYLVFALWSLLNIATGHATSKSTALSMTMTMFLNLTFLYACVCYCRYIADIRQVLRVIKGLAVLFCVLLLLGGLGTVFSGMRLSIFGVNSNRIAKFLAYAVIIAYYELMNKKERRFKDWAILLLLVLTILMTGSRKGLIIPIVGIYILVCIKQPKKFIKFSVLGVALGGILLFMLLNVDVLHELVGYRIEPVLQMLKGEEYAEASLNSRVDLIALAWESSQNSLFWGHGLDCFRLLSKSYGAYSHCNYVELLYSLGWVGVIIYYSPFVYGICNMYKYRNVSRELIGIVAALLIPFAVCDYLNITYFDRISLLIPAITLATVSKRGLLYECKKISQ